MNTKKWNSFFINLFTAMMLLIAVVLIVFPVRTQAKTKTITLLLSETKQISKKNVTSYKSMNPSIATVSDDGIVHAIKAGTAKITAITDDGRRSSGSVLKNRGLVYQALLTTALLCAFSRSHKRKRA